jgi:hypothetical protein
MSMNFKRVTQHVAQLGGCNPSMMNRDIYMLGTKKYPAKPWYANNKDLCTLAKTSVTAAESQRLWTDFVLALVALGNVTHSYFSLCRIAQGGQVKYSCDCHMLQSVALSC